MRDRIWSMWRILNRQSFNEQMDLVCESIESYEPAGGSLEVGAEKDSNEREKKIINCRFGINGETPRTLEQLGIEMGYSKERIRQLEDLALSKIREKREYRHFKDYIDD